MGRRSLAGAVLLVSALTATSALLGLARDVVIAGVFGADGELDAYLVAQGLLNVVLGLLAGGLVKAGVPVFARTAEVDDAATAAQRVGRTASVAMSGLVVVLGAGALLVGIVAGPVAGALAPGFDADESALAADLTRVLLVAVVLVAVTNLLAGVVQAFGRFAWSAAEGVPFNLVMIVAAAGFGPRYGVGALAVGFVLGSAARLVCQLPALRGLGLRLRPSLRLGDPGAREIARLLPPLLLGSAVTNVNTLVDRAVGSLVGEGAISALSYGWRLANLPDMLLTAALVTVSYPAFAAASTRPAELAALLDRALRGVVAVLVPVVAFLLVAATPVVALVFERGSFTPADTAASASAVVWYAPALLALAWRELVVRASYVVGDTRGPVLVALLAMVVNAVGDLTLGLSLGIPGLAASTTAAAVLAALANTWLLTRRHGIAGLGRALVSLWRVGLSGVVAALAAWAALAGTGPGDSTAGHVTGVVAAGFAAGATYWLVLLGLRAPERDLIGRLLGLVRARFNRGAR